VWDKGAKFFLKARIFGELFTVAAFVVFVWVLGYSAVFLDTLIEKPLKQTLEGMGHEDVSFKVSKFNLFELEVDGIELKLDGNRFSVGRVYPNLIEETISLSELFFLSEAVTAGAARITAPFDFSKAEITNIFVNAAEIDTAIEKVESYFEHNGLKLEDIILKGINISGVQAKSENFELEVPSIAIGEMFDTFEVNSASFKFDELKGTIKSLTGEGKSTVRNFADIEKFGWSGNLKISEAKVEAGDIDIPLFSGDGTLSVEQKKDSGIYAKYKGKLLGENNAFSVNFDLIHEPNKQILNIDKINYAFGGGFFSASKISIPMGDSGKNKSIKFTLNVEAVSAEELLKTMLEDKISITGKISGKLPITFTEDNNILVHNGILKAIEPGTLTLPPEYIPGDNVAVELVRNIVQNFHFSALVLELDTLPSGEMVIKMKIEGNNPVVENGRPVKLNVNLQGDMINLIQQNFMLLTKPQKLLQQTKEMGI